jgi:hypothetical protein
LGASYSIARSEDSVVGSNKICKLLVSSGTATRSNLASTCGLDDGTGSCVIATSCDVLARTFRKDGIEFDGDLRKAGACLSFSLLLLFCASIACSVFDGAMGLDSIRCDD